MKRLATITALATGLLLGSPEVRANEYPADNSGKNARDRADGAITADVQSNSESDLRITAEIRQALVADAALSTNAQNVKIVTAMGIVTLRGPVKSTEERASINAAALAVQGVTKIDNRIEIASD